MSRSLRNAVVLSVAFLSGTVLFAGQEQAKGIGPQSRLEVEYGFELDRNSKVTSAATLRELRTGDGFRFRVRSKQPAHAYLFVTRGADAFDLVLPREAGEKRSSMLSRNEWSTLPEKDWLRFDKTRGIERLYVLISTEAVEEIEDLFAARAKVDAVDETWLLDLRSRLEGGGTTTLTSGPTSTRVTHRRQGGGPALIFDALNVRHK